MYNFKNKGIISDVYVQLPLYTRQESYYREGREDIRRVVKLMRNLEAHLNSQSQRGGKKQECKLICIISTMKTRGFQRSKNKIITTVKEILT